MLKDNDFNLLSTDELSASDINGEIETCEAEIVSSTDELKEMSLSIQNENKKALAEMKKQVMYKLDKRKLVEAQKALTAIETIGDMFTDDEILSRVRDNINTAMDVKFLAEAQEKILKTHQNLMRLDTVDGSGTAKRISIGVRYEDDSGTKVETVIQTGGE